jgi:hypothetical protein
MTFDEVKFFKLFSEYDEIQRKYKEHHLHAVG